MVDNYQVFWLPSIFWTPMLYIVSSLISSVSSREKPTSYQLGWGRVIQAPPTTFIHPPKTWISKKVAWRRRPSGAIILLMMLVVDLRSFRRWVVAKLHLDAARSTMAIAPLFLWSQFHRKILDIVPGKWSHESWLVQQSKALSMVFTIK